MNLREKIEKEITEKVMTKLASERVELGTIDDLKKNLKKAIDTLKLSKFEVDEGKSRIQEKKNIADYIDTTEPKVKTINKFVVDLGSSELVVSKMVKDLGLSEGQIPELKQAKQLRQDLKNREDELRSIVKQLKS
jgi:FtsZ-binding cell division protein ZapB